ncbi:Uncharacterized protein HZ326_20556 [Fusarium oxysporum f. sp. albedinis]|nr:Uncharacterized protein HZ326_20556 [Fusarium oxysporum f. sp. albedinis]
MAESPPAATRRPTAPFLCLCMSFQQSSYNYFNRHCKGLQQCGDGPYPCAVPPVWNGKYNMSSAMHCRYLQARQE